MGLFDRFRYKKIEQSPGKNNRLSIGWSYPAKRNTKDFLESFHQNPRMNSVAMIASDVARASFKLFDQDQYINDKDNAKEIKNHIFHEIVKDPAPDMVGMDFYTTMYLITASRLVAGEAFCLIERDHLGMPRQMLYMPNTWVLSIPTASDPYYRISPLGNTTRKTINVPVQDILYWREANASDPYNRGRARSERIADELETDEYSAKWAKNSMFNSARPEMIVSMPGGTKEAAERLKEAWDGKFGGFRNSNRTAITAEKLKVNKLTSSAKEMDFVESRKYLKAVTREEFMIPPEMFGDVSNSNRSTIDAAQYLYSKNVLSRELDRTESILNSQLMYQYRDNVILVYNNIVPEDEITKVLQVKEAYALGAVTTNEYRKLLNLPPIKGGELLKNPVAQFPTPTKDVCDCGIDHKKKVFNKSLGDMDKAAMSAEMAFIESTKQWSTEQQKLFTAAYKEAGKNGLKGVSAIDYAIEKVFNETADKAVSDGLAPAWMIAMRKGAKVAEEVLGGSINMELLNPSFLQWIANNGLTKAQYINTTTKDALRLTLLEGLADGESIKKLSDRIQAVYKDLNGDEMERWRAERLARTETVSTVNAGAYETYIAEGVELLQWISGSEESGTRATHAAINGTIYKASEGLLVGGELLKYPGDPSASVGNIVNCRCAIIGIVA